MTFSELASTRTITLSGCHPTWGVSASEFEELRRLRREVGGAAHGAGDPAQGRRLSDGGAGPKIAAAQQDTTRDHARLHLDLHVSSAAEQMAEVAWLMAIGAERIDWDSHPDDPDFIVLCGPRRQSLLHRRPQPRARLTCPASGSPRAAKPQLGALLAAPNLPCARRPSGARRLLGWRRLAPLPPRTCRP
jgi:hypothetical protein